MHKTPFPHASRFFPALLAGLALLAFSGCATMTVTNLTPDTVPANPSQIYTITASAHANSNNVATETIKSTIIIDGQRFNMAKSTTGSDLWEFDYQLPPGRTGATYYFITTYAMRSGNNTTGATQELTSELYSLTVAGRYVLRPEASRAPVGSRVSVLGAGFTPFDVVYFGGTPTRTVFESPSSLSFFVPAVDAGRSYSLRIAGGGPDLDVGSFRVDAISFTVTPAELTLGSGEQQALTFTIPQPAPAGGMLVDVTTDAPESIVMPEVMIAAGQTSVTVAVQGGKPGSGSLFFKSSAGESSIPLAVTAK
jgi:hypothetical protein